MSTAPIPSAPVCSCKPHTPPPSDASFPLSQKRWAVRYFLVLAVLAAAWWLVYSHALPAATWVTVDLLGINAGSRLGAAVEFFLYDTVKILMLLVALVYLLAWVRTSLNVERVRDFLAGKRRMLGYFLGSLFGSVTPFCSCSSIPLFLGFTVARIPVGITMAFLITSPLINEIAVALLWGLLGWKFTLVYVAVGMTAGILGGAFMDAVKAERWLQPFILEAMRNVPKPAVTASGETRRPGIRERHIVAKGETGDIVKRVWKWVLIGVAVGAGLHGFVPENWFAENLGAGEWWTVPVAVLVAIPLYSSVTGIIPVMESLLVKGLPLGTTLAFCMSAVAASIPEVLLLRQIMTVRLQVLFIAYLWVVFTLAGWCFNLLGPYI